MESGNKDRIPGRNGDGPESGSDPLFMNRKSAVIHQLDHGREDGARFMIDLDDWDLLVDLLRDRDLTRKKKRIKAYCDFFVQACLNADRERLRKKISRGRLEALALSSLKHAGRAAAVVLAGLSVAV